MGALDRGAGPRSLGDITTTPPGEGGGFAFDEATMRSIIREWEDLAHSYDQSYKLARDALRVEGPGDEYASEGFAKAANMSSDSYMAYLRHNFEYCDAQATLFRRALDDYFGVEQSNADEIARTVHDVPQAGI
jgi:hypothetical protein